MKKDIHKTLAEAYDNFTKSEEKKKEKIVKGMKKNKDDFKKRYGKDAEAVMYATATKMAKESYKIEERNDPDADLTGKKFPGYTDLQYTGKRRGPDGDIVTYNAMKGDKEYVIKIQNGKIIDTELDEDVITLEDTQDFHEEFGYLAYSIDENDLFEAEYRGRKVKLNKPMQGYVKKFKVYVKDPKTGNVKKVNFGHGGSSVKGKSMRIRKNNPKARKSFRARHNCDNPGPKTKARYWSCRKW